MIALIIAACATAALDDCTVTQRIPLPPSMTMATCERVRETLLKEETGRLILPEGFNKVECELG
jgi:hypothetical protein